MKFERQFVRLIAAMIVMIIAYVAPSAVQAHEGHAHHGHHQGVVQKAEVAPSVVRTVSAPLTMGKTRTAAITALTAMPMAVVGLSMVGSLQSDEQGSGCCPGPCKGTCCGTMSCCVPGILTGAASLPMLAFGHVVMMSYDVSGLSGVGPGALPRPPRTLA